LPDLGAVAWERIHYLGWRGGKAPLAAEPGARTHR
jgi:hypothetical protein